MTEDPVPLPDQSQKSNTRLSETSLLKHEIGHVTGTAVWLSEHWAEGRGILFLRVHEIMMRNVQMPLITASCY